MSNWFTLRNFTIAGALFGFVGTRFLEDGNLLVTNVIVLFCAGSARLFGFFILRFRKFISGKFRP
jgi:cell division protein FtsX